MNKLQFVGTLALAAGLVLASADATAATDAKLFPGVGCRSYPAGGVLSYFAGTVMNSSADAELHVGCPLVRDSSAISSATIEVFDRNANVELVCNLFYEYSSGNTVFAASDSDTTGGGFYGSGVVTLNFTPLSGGDYYYATCQIPRTTVNGASHVVRVRVVETD